MLIIEIALGVILAVFILANLDVVLWILGLIIAIAILALALSGSLWFGNELLKELPLVITMIPILLGIFLGLFIMGWLAEKLLNLGNFFSITLTRYPKSSHDIYLYVEYVFHRLWLGSAHTIVLSIVFILIAYLLRAILNLKILDLYFAPLILVTPYLILIVCRVYKNSKAYKS